MCIECYEKYGSPSIINELTRRAAKLIEAVYEFNAAGGNAHIVVEDWNLDDGDIDFCLDEVKTNRRGDSADKLNAERQCLEALKALTLEERASALAIYDGFISGAT